MKSERKSGLRRLIAAAGHSAKGFTYAWKNEEAIRLELLLFLFLVPAGFYLGNDAVERSLLIGSCLVVLITEIFNSSIEAVVDRIGEEHHELSGAAKDMSSAAVVVGLALMILVWALILVEHLA